MSVKKIFTSFRNAGRGIIYVFKNEQNFRIQIIVSIFILALLFIFKIKRTEVIVILLLITLVLILEILNSAVEKFADIVKPRLHEQVKIVKDILAAMVLFSAVSSGIIGFIIFLPYVLDFWIN
ncbi:MAG: diacylglycerol kinase [Candidatus Magasanikbacteria bacterium]|nr:diacylglycerol kinase [Candidatus Magasanikbacteria bacterium]